MSKLKETKLSDVKLIYQMLYDTNKIFLNNKLSYWMIGGTLLGAVRSKGMIKWDDDGDIGILKNDVKKFLSLRKNFEECGYSIVKHWIGYKIFCTKRKKMEDFDYSYPFVDVFIYDLDEESGMYLSTSKRVRKEWPKDGFNEKELFPLALYKFNDYHLYGPRKYLSYFNRSYGDDWDKVAYREYDHSKEEEVERIKVKLTKKMIEPAGPYEVKDRKCSNVLIKRDTERRNEFFWKERASKTCKSLKEKCYYNFHFYNNTPISLISFLITCKSVHSTRYDKFVKYANIAKLNACVVDCVLGGKFTEGTVCKFVDNNVVSKKADMNKIELSINFSHFNSWQKFLNTCEDYCLIMEDDIELYPDFKSKINLIMSSLISKNIDFSILQLWDGHWELEENERGKKDREKFMSIKYKGDVIDIVKNTEEYNAGAVAYIISKKYANFLVNKSFPVKIPQDILMGKYVKKYLHLAVKMNYNKKEDIYETPLFYMNQGGEGGTGDSTQTYNAPTIKNYKCN